MKTYNTYQEAKIANPDSRIYKCDGEFTTNSSSGLGHILQPCNPADYCMTKRAFLESGELLCDGDLIFNNIAFLFVTTENKTNYNPGEIYSRRVNAKRNGDSDWFVIRAAALKTEHQQEMEELKPKRTRVEYVKVEFGNAWEALKEHSETGLYHMPGELYVSESLLFVDVTHGCEIYRKVEVEIDERQEFIDVYNQLRREFRIQHEAESFSDYLADSGKFKLVDGE